MRDKSLTTTKTHTSTSCRCSDSTTNNTNIYILQGIVRVMLCDCVLLLTHARMIHDILLAEYVVCDRSLSALRAVCCTCAVCHAWSVFQVVCFVGSPRFCAGEAFAPLSATTKAYINIMTHMECLAELTQLITTVQHHLNIRFVTKNQVRFSTGTRYLVFHNVVNYIRCLLYHTTCCMLFFCSCATHLGTPSGETL